MKKKHYLSLMTCLVLSSNSFAGTTDDALNAMSGGWGQAVEQESKPAAEAVDDGPIEMSESITLEPTCREDEQTSLPKSFFESLLRNGRLNARQRNQTSGDAIFSGGQIIANCQDMLDLQVDPPRNGRPYLFHAGIKKNSTICKPDEKTGKEMCTYKAHVVSDTIDNAAAKEDLTITVEPNLNGFIQCLKKTGVLEDVAADENSPKELKFNEKKIVSSDFNYTKESLAYDTAEVLYVCHGPECSKGSPQSESSRSEGNCRWYEPLTDAYGDPIQFYSERDAREIDLKAQFQVVCNQKNYRDILDQKARFSEFEYMYQALESIGESLLRDAVKDIHTQLAENETYENLDAADINQTMKDFYNRIVNPLKKDILGLQREIEKSKSKEERKRLQEELDVLISELVAYSRDPYVTSKDYSKMQDFAKKAQLEKKDWRDSALYAYYTSNSAYHLLRYHSKPTIFNRKYKEKVISVAKVNGKLAQHALDEQDYMAKLGELANDKSGDVSFAAEAKEDAAKVAENYNKKIQALYQKQQKLLPCSRSNYQSCARQVQSINEQIASLQENQQAYTAEIESLNNESEQWSEIEEKRNKLYGIKTRTISSTNTNTTQANQQAALLAGLSGNSNLSFAQQMALIQQLNASGSLTANAGVGVNGTTNLGLYGTTGTTSNNSANAAALQAYYARLQQQQYINQLQNSNQYGLTGYGTSSLLTTSPFINASATGSFSLY